MISQMDQIYANAAFTIIAAADGDTELGLCGVSMPRQLQRRVHIQDVILLELPSAAAGLTSSKWATRGWTYQEGYLSRRRLIFTKTQVLFVCNGMYATESLQKLLDTTCSSGSKRSEFNHLFPQHHVLNFRFRVKDLLHQIQEYSTRELSRPSDSLNAILGVLSYYAKGSANRESPYLQLPWGLMAYKGAKKNSFDLPCFWHHKKKLPTRRPDFPSWSWLGWGGPLKFLGPEIILQPESTIEKGSLFYLDWHLSMRYADGKTLEMYEIACKEFEARKSKDRIYQPGPKQLLVSCLVIPVSFLNLNLTEDQRRKPTAISIHDTGELFSVRRNGHNEVHPTLQIWEGIYAGLDRSRLYLDQKIENQDHILGLLSGIRKGKSGFGLFHCLLARQMGDGLYERVGLLEMRDLTDLQIRGRIYVDAVGSVLDRFTISDAQRRHPFADTAERRTICLV